eukprot:1555514-Ditylum_brightwellii.AAC.1
MITLFLKSRWDWINLDLSLHITNQFGIKCCSAPYSAKWGVHQGTPNRQVLRDIKTSMQQVLQVASQIQDMERGKKSYSNWKRHNKRSSSDMQCAKDCRRE